MIAEPKHEIRRDDTVRGKRERKPCVADFHERRIRRQPRRLVFRDRGRSAIGERLRHELRAVGLGDSGALGNVGEAPLPQVPVEPIGSRAVHARGAVVGRADRVDTPAVSRELEVEIVGDEQIEMAVTVVVDERGARAGSWPGR